MSAKQNEDLLRKIAHAYVEHQGSELNRQAGNIFVPAEAEAGLDAKLRAGLPAKERPARKYRGMALGITAAGLLLVASLVLRAGGWQIGFFENSAGSASATQSEPPTGGAEDAWGSQSEAAAEGAAPLPGGDGATEESEGGAGDTELIPLGFQLPEAYIVQKVEPDNGRTVYTLRHALEDDVVLTLTYLHEAEEYTGLYSYTIAGEQVMGTHTADYSLLVVEQNGIQYSMVSSHDLATLVPLAEALLSA